MLSRTTACNLSRGLVTLGVHIVVERRCDTRGSA